MGSTNIDEMNEPLISELRHYSRQLVRELGFMNSEVAGTKYAPSAVHTLFEISHHPKITASELCAPLNLDKSSVSRVVKKMVEAGEVVEEFDGGGAGMGDGRVKRLELSPKGWDTVRGVDEFGNHQVSTALSRLPPTISPTAILTGLRVYASALRSHRLHDSFQQSIPSYASPISPQPQIPPQEIQIVTGYRPGLISSTIGLQIAYYGPGTDYGLAFEAVLAKGMSELVPRLDGVNNEVWCAISEGKIVGVVWIDGECLNGAGVETLNNVPTFDHEEDMVKAESGRGGKKAYLRYFIVGQSMHGKGIGKKLLDRAVEFCDERGFESCELSTFTGPMFDAARNVYGSRGFVCVGETVEKPWGVPLLQQWLVRRRGGVV